MRKIILDTNFLMIPYKFKVDIFSEIDRVCRFNYRLCIFEQTITELKKIIEKQTGKDKRAAQLALKLIKLKNIGMINPDGTDVDLLILEHANEDMTVATQDIELRKELMKKGVSVIMLRQKKYLKLLERKLYK